MDAMIERSGRHWRHARRRDKWYILKGIKNWEKKMWPALVGKDLIKLEIMFLMFRASGSASLSCLPCSSKRILSSEISASITSWHDHRKGSDDHRFMSVPIVPYRQWKWDSIERTCFTFVLRYVSRWPLEMWSEFLINRLLASQLKLIQNILFAIEWHWIGSCTFIILLEAL